MKVLLLNPPAVGDVGFVREGRCEQRLASFQYLMVPISLPSTAAVLRDNNHSVGVLDCIAENYDFNMLENYIKEENYDVIIMNISTVTFDADSSVARELKAQNPDLIIVAYGVHATTLPEETLIAGFDVAIRREPEYTALALMNALTLAQDLHSVEGISYKDEDRVINNPDRPFIEDLDSLPFPARDLLDNSKYLAPLSDNTQTLIVTSRGCPHACVYCTAHCYYGKKPRHRSAVNIVDEIQESLEKYNVDVITMWADTFTMDRENVIAVCDEIEKRGLDFEWMCNSRVDTVDLELLKRMKRAGCSTMSFGVESGVQDILDNVKKKITLEQITSAFNWTRDAGIESMAHVIFGLPGENKQTIKETVRFVKSLKPDYVQFYCAVPFPGTDFYKMAQEQNWLITEDWSRFEINQAIISTNELSADELARQRTMAYRTFYLDPRYIGKKLMKLSNLEETKRLFKGGISFLKDWVWMEK